MIETLLGGLLGGAFRLAPELLKWLDRKRERGHELSMQDKALCLFTLAIRCLIYSVMLYQLLHCSR